MLKKILFLGSDNISKICLETLHKAYPHYEWNVLTTSENSPPGLYGNRNGMNVQFEAGGKMSDWKSLQPGMPIWSQYFDYMIVASFGYLIPASLINHCERSLNMHPSLLPKYRGASPIQYCIFNRDEKTGVSIIKIHPEVFDKGRIMVQEEIKNHDLTNTTYDTLSPALAQLGGNLLLKVLDNYNHYEKLSWEQDEDKVVKAPRISSDFSKLSFHDTTEEVYARFRSIFGTSINPHFFFRNKR